MRKPLAVQRQAGFTIVELLIVIVVIAILAAISVVAYTGIQNRANDTAIQSDLKNIGQKITEFQITNPSGNLPSTPGNFTPMGLKASKNSYGNHYLNLHNMAYCHDSTTNTFAIVAASKSGNVFVYKNGSVQPGVGPLVTHGTTCSNNGQSTTGSTWFYAAGSWQTYIGE